LISILLDQLVMLLDLLLLLVLLLLMDQLLLLELPPDPLLLLLVPPLLLGQDQLEQLQHPVLPSKEHPGCTPPKREGGDANNPL